MSALKTSKGFTLVELLVVVAIIGILAAIALPQFSAYRKKGFNARIMSDARNGATAEEAYYIDAQHYLTSGNCSSLTGMTVSGGVTCTLAAGTGTDSYKIKTTHPNAAYTTGCFYDSGANPNMSCS
ncbi:MAG TPA: prepilin-type N-terminal cleavage/methylation domain-containing protein [Candidatus Binatia bacterium]|nr:prepilin-type N-terminal cleavage/methylation domain-containing protein [Candidatus Binatia bacterium]